MSMEGGSNPRGRPKGGSSEETHESIVDAARRLFAERGYAQTQNRRVAADAGVTTSTLYHYFRNKQDMYLTVYRDAERRVADRYRRAVEAADDPSEAMIGVLDAARRLHEEDPSLPFFLASVPVEMRHHPELGVAVARCPIETDAILRDLITSLISQSRGGEVDPADPDVEARVSLFFAITVGIALYAKGGDHAAYGRMLDAFRGFDLQGI